MAAIDVYQRVAKALIDAFQPEYDALRRKDNQ